MTNPNWSAIPAARTRLPLLKLRLWSILGVLGLSALLGLFALMRGGPSTVVVAATASPTAATAEAQLAATSWASGTPVRVPAAAGLFSGNNRILDNALAVTNWAPAAVSESSIGERTFEMHTYRVTTVANQLLDVTFTFEVTETPQLIAFPHVTPSQVSDPAAAGVFCEGEICAADWTEGDLVEAIEDWASAWASGDEDALVRSVGRPAEAGDYVALGTHTFEPGSVRIASAWSSEDAVWVQVSFEISDQDLVDAEGAPNGPVSRVGSDLLVTRADGVAHVVAWGPVGSGPTLKSYGSTVES